MTPQQFKALIAVANPIRIEKTRQAVYEVVVNGMKGIQAAYKYDVHTPRISEGVQRMLLLHKLMLQAYGPREPKQPKRSNQAEKPKVPEDNLEDLL